MTISKFDLQNSYPQYWSGTDSSAERIIDIVHEYDNGYGSWRSSKRLVDVYAHELIVDTLSSIVTLKRGDGIRKINGVWVRVSPEVARGEK